MQIILTEDVVGVGDIGETVRVKPGYARNYLIPRGSAIEVGAASAKQIAHMTRRIEAKKRQLKAAAEERGKDVSALRLEFELRVGSGGKVFGSVGNRDIAAALMQNGIEVDRRRVLLTEPIRTVGEKTVMVKLHPEVQVPLTVVVTKAAATRSEEEEETDEARAALDSATNGIGAEEDEEESEFDAGEEEAGEVAEEEADTEN